MSKKNDLPMIAISASAFEQHRERCLKAGADDFLPKPFEMEKLLKSLQRLLELELVLEDDLPAIESCGHAHSAPHGTGLNQIVLPPEYRTALIELARRGDVKGLCNQAVKLQQFDMRYKAFAETLKILEERFQVKKNRRILEATREGF